MKEVVEVNFNKVRRWNTQAGFIIFIHDKCTRMSFQQEMGSEFYIKKEKSRPYVTYLNY